MINRKLPHVLLATVLTFSAIHVNALVSASGTSRIEIRMSAEQMLLLGKKEKTKVDDATLQVFEDGQASEITEVSIGTRGQTSIKFPRKNFNIETLKNQEDGDKRADLKIGHIDGKDLILSAGAQDPLLIKNMLAYRLLSAVNVPTLETGYTEVIINDKSQGLYMVTKSPVEHLLKKDNGVDIVLRRRYNDFIELKKAKKTLSENDVKAYTDSLNDLHQNLTKLSGEELLAALEKRMDLDTYMRWLAVNFLIKNSDYSDEVFFTGQRNADGEIYFKIFPWDLDDSFGKKMHLAIVPFGPNSGQKQRSEKQMLYNFESRLDQAISKDKVLLNKYFSVVAAVTSELTDEKINHVFNSVQRHLEPYLQDSDVLANGALDEAKKAHDSGSAIANINDKRVLVKQRLLQIQSELKEIEQQGTDRSQKFNPVSKKLGYKIMELIRRISDKKQTKGD